MKKLKKFLKQLIAPGAMLGAFLACPCCSRGAMFNFFYTVSISSVWSTLKPIVNRFIPTRIKR